LWSVWFLADVSGHDFEILPFCKKRPKSVAPATTTTTTQLQTQPQQRKRVTSKQQSKKDNRVPSQLTTRVICNDFANLLFSLCCKNLCFSLLMATSTFLPFAFGTT